MAALRVASALTRGIKRLVMTNDCTKRANGRYSESVHVFFFGGLRNMRHAQDAVPVYGCVRNAV